MFELNSETPIRKGVIHTSHGDLQTPFFMPIATRGAVKTLSTKEIEDLGSPIVLSNTYHLFLRPGLEIMERMGGLHRFMDWNGAILTDSGGFQVFSLSQRRKVTEEGVLFRSPIDGAEHLLTPERSMEIQLTLGSDVLMCFDEVIALPATEQQTLEAVERTERWAKRCKDYYESHVGSSKNPNAKLFGIIQGGTDHALRQKSAEGLLKIGFDGYAIGGLSVGEPFQDALAVLDELLPILPKDRPRYFMGGAQPHQIVEYVKRGVDMFDCVLPTRNARHGHLYRWKHPDLTKPDFYEVINLMNAKWKGSTESLLDPNLPESKGLTQKELGRYTMGYLHHLFDVQEMLAYRLATMQNLLFYLQLFERMRRGD
ncbi:tRNA guanosine(34) transglycosylase Tgt [Candidatus Uhrbacteria bacterium]|nr:tRNA guanosine(34) transglycosylase Tgt [Candidatus Uhrbacteria bacterium]MBD3284560.1 tRNA guanosine(34) transglycosylase Tgt [Candidatus Uhrbacteria bacterium]